MSLWNAPRALILAAEFRVMPVMAHHDGAWHAFARSEPVRRFVRIVTRRDIPPSILDMSVLEQIARFVDAFGVEEGARRFRDTLTATEDGRRLLALCRAAYTNSRAMAARGVNLWDA